jgi:hypothetical protein
MGFAELALQLAEIGGQCPARGLALGIQGREKNERTWHQAPGAAQTVRHLCRSGADGQSAVPERDASPGGDHPAGVPVTTSGDVRDQPRFADTASELLQDVFGKDKSPCRLVYGGASLPLGTAVELEVVLEVSD